MKKILFTLLVILITSGCVAPKEMRQDGFTHKLFRCYGWQQKNHCAPYAYGLAMRLAHHNIDHRMLCYRTTFNDPEYGYHMVVWFQYKGAEYIMDNESEVPKRVKGKTILEKLRNFSPYVRYVVYDTEQEELYNPAFDPKHYKKMIESLDNYKKECIIQP